MRWSRAEVSDPEVSGRREWLVTNGTGSYAMGTVSGELSRGYHGLLVAALEPPLGRTVLLAKLEETVVVGTRTYPLSVNRWTSGAVEPNGCHHLERFELQDGLPVFTYAIGDALLSKRIWMAPGNNTTFVRYELLRSSGPVRLSITALVTRRGHHGRTPADAQLWAEPFNDGVRVQTPTGPSLWLTTDKKIEPLDDWWEGFFLAREKERGLEPREDLYAAARVGGVLELGGTLTVWAHDAETRVDADEAHRSARARARALVDAAPTTLTRDADVAQLVVAADQFLVRRGAGRSVIAGYPWFGDWGRDTMIALPGLTLTTGPFELAKELLVSFGEHLDQGMLPNRFLDDEPPEHNTVDATLHYFEALQSYVDASGDLDTAELLFSKLLDVLDWHRRGTRHGIQVDPEDGLLRAGEPGFALTWMDARVDGRPITPRIGKPVEVNALYYSALKITEGLGRKLGRDVSEVADQAEQTQASFERFWNRGRGYLYDVIDGPEGDDGALRPNAVLAVAVHDSPIPLDRQRAVIEVAARTLWTPVGLRSLSRGEPGYRASFAGPPEVRDAAYHQGAVWGWLLGPFVRAHVRLHGDVAAARAYLEPMLGSLREHGLGTLSEVFEPEPPFAPRGCVAQAWTVAETLRAWAAIEDAAGE